MSILAVVFAVQFAVSLLVLISVPMRRSKESIMVGLWLSSIPAMTLIVLYQLIR